MLNWIKSKIPAAFLTPVVIVSTLGYFVDTFDIVIFSITRVDSLTELGLSGEALTEQGIFLFNMQLVGMVVGGIVWGYIGDKMGRSSALLASILCYSLANIANGFVHGVETYALCRFVSGFGLAGELAAAVTLVMEEMPKKIRGLGGLVITCIGAMGAVTAAALSGMIYWRHLYILGGIMGLILLFARSKVKDSRMFEQSMTHDVVRGHFLYLFSKWKHFKNLLICLLIGTPHYLCIGIIVTLCPEISAAMGLETPLSVGIAMMIYGSTLALGDMSATIFSQYIQSRKRAVSLFLGGTVISFMAFFAFPPETAQGFYTFFGLFGFVAGFFMLTPIITAEMFGTNMRVTATSAVTNFIRASAIVMNFGIITFKEYFDFLTATQIVCALVLGSAVIATIFLKETFHKDMDFFD